MCVRVRVCKDSLFGKERARLEQEAVKGCVLVCELWRGGGAFEVQAAHDDVQHRCDGRQLHTVEHSRHLRRDGVHVRLLIGHGC